MTFNENPTQMVQSNESSTTINNFLSSAIQRSNNASMYTMKAIIPDEAPRSGTHHGFFGLLIHATKGTVIKFHHRTAEGTIGILCRSKKTAG